MPSTNLIATVDSRIHLPLGLPATIKRAVRKSFTHTNPAYNRKRGAGYSTWGVDSVIRTYTTDEITGALSVPRGGAQRLREVAREYGLVLRLRDSRTAAPVVFPPYKGHEPRPYQSDIVRTAVARQQGIVRAPTGSGKSMSALRLIHELQQRAMVLVNDQNLMAQWVGVARHCFGCEVGTLGASKRYQPGCPIVVAMVQTLARAECARLHALLESESFGALIVDECQTVAANMFQAVVDNIPAKYRIGFSADETRRDRMEFLIYDIMGTPIYEVSRTDLIKAGVIHAVDARVVPTEFEADWYVNAESSERNFTQLVTEMSEDDVRNELVLRIVDGLLAAGEVPAMVFVHRRDHVAALRSMLVARGIPSATLLGGSGSKREFERAVVGLRDGTVKVAVGTYKAIGQGIDIPVIRAGLCATPISRKNAQFFNQVRGRICRTARGKHDASLYYLWDQHVFPRQLGVLEEWNDKCVTVLDSGGRWISPRAMRHRMRRRR